MIVETNRTDRELLIRIDERMKSVQKAVEKQNGRVTKLEEAHNTSVLHQKVFQAKAIAIASTIATVSTLSISGIINWLKGSI